MKFKTLLLAESFFRFTAFPISDFAIWFGRQES